MPNPTQIVIMQDPGSSREDPAGSPLSPAQLQWMSVEEVWKSLEDQPGAFKWLVKQTVARLVEQHRTETPPADDLKEALYRHGAEPFEQVIERLVLSAPEHAPTPENVVKAYNEARVCADKQTLCHAPSTSMYFGIDGSISVCCYTRAHPIGRYPQGTIAGIWSSHCLEKMRSQLQRSILPVGCGKCADQLLAENYTGLLAASFDGFAEPSARSLWKRTVQPPKTPAYPVCMEFELSNKCNLECGMCSGFCSSSIRANRENLPPLPALYGSAFVEELKPYIPHLKQAKFYGGEPFLIDLYYEIWELFIETNPGCEIFITSNGTVFTPKVQRVLERLNCRVTISLDSVNKTTYESIRRNATMEKTLVNVEKFKEINRRGGRQMSLNVCPMVTNWREMPEMVSFANANGLKLFFTTVTYPENLALKYLAPAEQQVIADHFSAANAAPADETEAANFLALSDLTQQVRRWIDSSHDRPALPILQ